MERCPVCRARLRGASRCPRCDADLEQPLRIERHAQQLVVAAAQRLAAGELDQAQTLFRQANALKSDPLTAALWRFSHQLASGWADYRHLGQ